VFILPIEYETVNTFQNKIKKKVYKKQALPNLLEDLMINENA